MTDKDLLGGAADDLERIDRSGEEPVAVALLALLPDEQREAVRERVLRERGDDEIAVDAGVPEAMNGRWPHRRPREPIRAAR